MPTFTSAYNASKISQYRPTANSISSKRSIPHRASADTILLAALLAPLPINLFPLWVQINRMESGRLLRRETEVSNRRNCHLFLVPPATHRKDCSGGGGGREGGRRARAGEGEVGARNGWGECAAAVQVEGEENSRTGETRPARLWLTAANMAVPKSPFCSLSAALRKLLHPHLRIHAKSKPSARPLSPIHPSMRPYHLSLSLSLSHTLASDNRSRRVAAPLHFFARPSLNAVSIPRDTSSSRGTAPLRRGDTSIELNSRRSKDQAIVYEVNHHQFFLLHLVV